MKIYNTARAAPTPALNALATLMLVAAMLAVVLGFLVYRWSARRAGGDTGLGSFAGEVWVGRQDVVRRGCPSDQLG